MYSTSPSLRGSYAIRLFHTIYDIPSLSLSCSMLSYPQGALLQAAIIQMEEFDDADSALKAYFGTADSSRRKRQSDGSTYSTDTPGTVRSSFILVASDSGDSLSPDTGMSVTLSLKLDSGAGSSTKVYVSNENTQGTFRELDTRVENGMAIVSTDEEGVYVASSPAVAAYITVGTVLFVLIIVAIAVVGLVVYFRVRREKWERVKNSVSGVSRSFQKKV